MKPAFYSDLQYKKGQSEKVKAAWKRGMFVSLIKPPEEKICTNPTCQKIFFVPVHRKNAQFCSYSCSARVSNTRRDPFPAEVRRKISKSLTGKTNPYKGIRKVMYVQLICGNPLCRKTFEQPPYKSHQKYCSVNCAIKVIGGQTTSPKASKGKSGVRLDIDQNIIFYSTWESNVARVFNLVGLEWQFSPHLFKLGNHTYRPDFYLPAFQEYVEVKNFMNSYSLERDTKFRLIYPEVKLSILSKKEYLAIKKNYSELIQNWE